MFLIRTHFGSKSVWSEPINVLNDNNYIQLTIADLHRVVKFADACTDNSI